MIELSYKMFTSRSFEKKVRIFIHNNSCVHILAVFMFQTELKNQAKHFQNSLFGMVIGSCHGKVQLFFKNPMMIHRF